MGRELLVDLPPVTQQQETAIETVRREVEDGASLYCKPLKRETLRRLLQALAGQDKPIVQQGH